MITIKLGILLIISILATLLIITVYYIIPYLGIIADKKVEYFKEEKLHEENKKIFKKGSVYNPSKDLDRRMKGDNVDIFD